MALSDEELLEQVGVDVDVTDDMPDEVQSAVARLMQSYAIAVANAKKAGAAANALKYYNDAEPEALRELGGRKLMPSDIDYEGWSFEYELPTMRDTDGILEIAQKEVQPEDLEQVAQIGPSRAAQLREVGVETIDDLAESLKDGGEAKDVLPARIQGAVRESAAAMAPVERPEQAIDKDAPSPPEVSKRDETVFGGKTADKVANQKYLFGDLDEDGTANVEDIQPLDASKDSRFYDELSLGTELKTWQTIVRNHRRVYNDLAVEDDDIKKGRIKQPVSIIRKLRENYLDELKDVVGTMTLVDDHEEGLELAETITDRYDVIDEDNYFADPKNATYYAYHVNFKYDATDVDLEQLPDDPTDDDSEPEPAFLKQEREVEIDGKTVELAPGEVCVEMQIKTEEEMELADEMHEVYKKGESLEPYAEKAAKLAKKKAAPETDWKAPLREFDREELAENLETGELDDETTDDEDAESEADDSDRDMDSLHEKAREREFATKEFADIFRDLFPQYIAEDDNASMKTVTFTENTPEPVLQEAAVYSPLGNSTQDTFTTDFAFPEAMEYADDDALTELTKEYGTGDGFTKGQGVDDPRFSPDAMGYDDDADDEDTESEADTDDEADDYNWNEMGDRLRDLTAEMNGEWTLEPRHPDEMTVISNDDVSEDDITGWELETEALPGQDLGSTIEIEIRGTGPHISGKYRVRLREPRTMSDEKKLSEATLDTMDEVVGTVRNMMEKHDSDDEADDTSDIDFEAAKDEFTAVAKKYDMNVFEDDVTDDRYIVQNEYGGPLDYDERSHLSALYIWLDEGVWKVSKHNIDDWDRYETTEEAAQALDYELYHSFARLRRREKDDWSDDIEEPEKPDGMGPEWPQKIDSDLRVLDDDTLTVAVEREKNGFITKAYTSGHEYSLEREYDTKEDALKHGADILEYYDREDTPEGEITSEWWNRMVNHINDMDMDMDMAYGDDEDTLSADDPISELTGVGPKTAEKLPGDTIEEFLAGYSPGDSEAIPAQYREDIAGELANHAQTLYDGAIALSIWDEGSAHIQYEDGSKARLSEVSRDELNPSEVEVITDGANVAGITPPDSGHTILRADEPVEEVYYWTENTDNLALVDANGEYTPYSHEKLETVASLAGVPLGIGHALENAYINAEEDWPMNIQPADRPYAVGLAPRIIQKADDVPVEELRRAPINQPIPDDPDGWVLRDETKSDGEAIYFPEDAENYVESDKVLVVSADADGSTVTAHFRNDSITLMESDDPYDAPALIKTITSEYDPEDVNMDMSDKYEVLYKDGERFRTVATYIGHLDVWQVTYNANDPDNNRDWQELHSEQYDTLEEAREETEERSVKFRNEYFNINTSEETSDSNAWVAAYDNIELGQTVELGNTEYTVEGAKKGYHLEPPLSSSSPEYTLFKENGTVYIEDDSGRTPLGGNSSDGIEDLPDEMEAGSTTMTRADD